MRAQLGRLGVGAAQFVAAAACFDGGLSDLGLAAAGVRDRLPGTLADGLVGCFDLGVLWDRDRVGRAVGADGRDHVIGEEPRVGAHRHARVRRQAPHPRQGLASEALVAALRRPRPHPRMQHLAGVCSHRHQRVIAQHLGVAIGGALLGLSAHLTHRGVQIQRHLRDVGRGAHRPRPRQRMLGRFVELAHMPERERPQERPLRRRGHHIKGQHRARRARPQPLHVVDAAAPHQRRRHQRQHLAARARARRAAQTHRVVDQSLQTQPIHHRARQQQPRIGHQRPIVEHRLQPVDPTCYPAHRKCLLTWPE